MEGSKRREGTICGRAGKEGTSVRRPTVSPLERRFTGAGPALFSSQLLLSLSTGPFQYMVTGERKHA